MSIQEVKTAILQDGWTVCETEMLFRATKPDSFVCIEWLSDGENPPNAFGVRVRRLLDKDDPIRDYCAGLFCDDAEDAIETAERMNDHYETEQCYLAITSYEMQRKGLPPFDYGVSTIN